jgi:hypothetical protein
MTAPKQTFRTIRNRSLTQMFGCFAASAALSLSDASSSPSPSGGCRLNTNFDPSFYRAAHQQSFSSSSDDDSSNLSDTASDDDQQHISNASTASAGPKQLPPAITPTTATTTTPPATACRLPAPNLQRPPLPLPLPLPPPVAPSLCVDGGRLHPDEVDSVIASVKRAMRAGRGQFLGRRGFGGAAYGAHLRGRDYSVRVTLTEKEPRGAAAALPGRVHSAFVERPAAVVTDGRLTFKVFDEAPAASLRGACGRAGGAAALMDAEGLRGVIAECVEALGEVHDLGWAHGGVEPESFLVSGVSGGG